MKLRSIEAEERACRKAWKGKRAGSDTRAGSLGWHIHHARLYEELTVPATERIDYIVQCKPKRERALRLRLMRPVKNPRALRTFRSRDIEALHRKECRGCPWDGRTIFAKAKS